MDPRYANPEVTELWSPGWTYGAWLAIETRTLKHQRDAGIVPAEETQELLDRLYGLAVQDSDVEDIASYEEETRHDVVAFLRWLREDAVGGGLPRDDVRWLHFGLTSSDVVDTAQGMRFREMYECVVGQMNTLISALTRHTLSDTPVVGRTHGQVAEPMSMRARAEGWISLLAPVAADLSRNTRRVAVCKLSGPVGTYAHNPPEIEVKVAMDLDLRPHGMGATQIASRAPLAAWAASANLVVQALAKIAHDIRLMTLLGETETKMAPGQVGSSSMAHKRNPIRAERIEGLARMAEGYASMLGKLGTWLERDIAQSSVERVAVPDLWHVLMFAIEETTTILRLLGVKWPEEDASGEAYVSWFTLRAIEQGMPVEEARAHAIKESKFQIGRPQSPVTYMANYPSSR
jgi:adenylosuccinate lyase